MSWIDTDEGLKAWCEEAMSHDVVAVDTEFVWTKTYYPSLGLLQMAYDKEHAALFDVLAISDTTPMKALLESTAVTKVFHEAASDLPILRRWCGALPKNIVDTRVAAGFAGLTASLSLAKLLAQLLGVELAKTETRTDWLQRPLSPEQIEYGLDDVRYMPELYCKLRSMLESNSNYEWFIEEMGIYSEVSYYDEIRSEDCWKHVSGMGRYAGHDLAVIRELASWREEKCRTMNIARPRLVSDEQILLAAEKRPKNMSALIHDLKMWAKTASRFGEEIIDCIQRAESLDSADCPQQHGLSMDVKVLKSRRERVMNLAKKRATARQIDPILACVRRDADSFVIAVEERSWPFEHRLLNGWRKELLGNALEEMALSKFA